VRRRLAENELKPWRKDMWCIPQVDGEFVARMEDVLDLDAEEPDRKRPVVCFDESPTQLFGEVRQPIKAKPAQPERYDCEYKRIDAYIDPAAQGRARASVGQAEWLQPFSRLFGNPDAFSEPRQMARIIAFPGCFQGELAQIRAELEELKRTIRGGCW
jgi:hypothetical protein